MVQRRRSSNTDSINLAQQFFVISQRLHTMFVCYFLRGIGIGVNYSNEIAVFMCGIFFSVKFPKIPDADNGDFKLGHGCDYFL